MATAVHLFQSGGPIWQRFKTSMFPVMFIAIVSISNKLLGSERGWGGGNLAFPNRARCK